MNRRGFLLAFGAALAVPLPSVAFDERPRRWGEGVYGSMCECFGARLHSPEASVLWAEALRGCPADLTVILPRRAILVLDNDGALEEHAADVLQEVQPGLRGVVCRYEFPEGITGRTARVDAEFQDGVRSSYAFGADDFLVLPSTIRFEIAYTVRM